MATVEYNRQGSLRVVRCRPPSQARADARKRLRPALGKPRRRKPRDLSLASAGAAGYGDLNGADTQVGVNAATDLVSMTPRMPLMIARCPYGP